MILVVRKFSKRLVRLYSVKEITDFYIPGERLVKPSAPGSGKSKVGLASLLWWHPTAKTSKPFPWYSALDPCPIQWHGIKEIERGTAMTMTDLTRPTRRTDLRIYTLNARSLCSNAQVSTLIKYDIIGVSETKRDEAALCDLVEGGPAYTLSKSRKRGSEKSLLGPAQLTLLKNGTPMYPMYPMYLNVLNVYRLIFWKRQWQVMLKDSFTRRLSSYFPKNVSETTCLSSYCLWVKG